MASFGLALDSQVISNKKEIDRTRAKNEVGVSGFEFIIQRVIQDDTAEPDP